MISYHLIHGSNKIENQKEKTELNSQLSATPTTQHPKGIAARITRGIFPPRECSPGPP